MKTFISYILVFFMFISSIDLALVNLCNCSFIVFQNSSISDIMKTQYEVFEQAKNIFSNVCDNIIKDVQNLISYTYIQNTSINNTNIFILKDKSSFINLSTENLVVCVNKLINSNIDFRLLLFFFGFVFIFLLEYIGLLKTFWNELDIYYVHRKLSI